MVSLTEELKLVRIGFVNAHPLCILGYELLNLGDNVKHFMLSLSLKVQVIRRWGKTGLGFSKRPLALRQKLRPYRVSSNLTTSFQN
jgi:hypothetical protein